MSEKNSLNNGMNNTGNERLLALINAIVNLWQQPCRENAFLLALTTECNSRVKSTKNN